MSKDNKLSEENLNKKVSFTGEDCHGYFRCKVGWMDDFTLRDFLREVIDP